MAAAIRLRRAGWDPVIAERAPERRRGGYFIGIYPEGREAARKLGVFDDIHTRTPKSTRTWETDRIGLRSMVREAFGDLAGTDVAGHALQQLERADEILFDSVSQVERPAWHTRRVVLVGDAAWCLSLFSGMGASAGMVGASALGDMLDKHPGDLAALAAWDAQMRPFILKHQRSARIKANIFAPSNIIVAGLRRRLMLLGGRKRARQQAAAVS